MPCYLSKIASWRLIQTCILILIARMHPWCFPLQSSGAFPFLATPWHSIIPITILPEENDKLEVYPDIRLDTHTLAEPLMLPPPIPLVQISPSPTPPTQVQPPNTVLYQLPSYLRKMTSWRCIPTYVLILIPYPNPWCFPLPSPWCRSPPPPPLPPRCNPLTQSYTNYHLTWGKLQAGIVSQHMSWYSYPSHTPDASPSLWCTSPPPPPLPPRCNLLTQSYTKYHLTWGKWQAGSVSLHTPWYSYPSRTPDASPSHPPGAHLPLPSPHATP